MKKILAAAFFSAFLLLSICAQSDDELFFSDDDLFGDDGIVEIDTAPSSDAQNALNHGSLFTDGSIKLGGSFETSISTVTKVYSPDDDTSFTDKLYGTTFSPSLSATFTLDARPTQILRMYSKVQINPENLLNGTSSTWFFLKELFTDFSFADRAFCRFGLHTVTWGTGMFFSPVSDIINTSSIDPEDTDKQVNGSLNLRTQITFPGTQNCLWFYVIPSQPSALTALSGGASSPAGAAGSGTGASAAKESYAHDTGFAAKGDFVFGGWELGVGGFFKYQKAPEAMLTFSGSIIKGKVSVFGEAVYKYGSDSEWTKDSSFEDKTNIFMLTAGAMYYWKTPEITFAGQYYYDSNDKDMAHKYFTKGHNAVLLVNFARLFGTSDVTASIYGMVNFGKEELSPLMQMMAASYGLSSSFFSCGTFSAQLSVHPVKDFSISAGPYITFADWETEPDVSFKITLKLGGGKF